MPTNNVIKEHEPIIPEAGHGDDVSYTNIPITPSKVLMVEVDNVKHEPYKQTEEVKVLILE